MLRIVSHGEQSVKGSKAVVSEFALELDNLRYTEIVIEYTNPCGKSLPRGGSAKQNGMRRYVIDEVMGSVDVLCQFDSLGAWPDSHEIRVVDGKVKYVHTVTVMRGVGS
jgi:hypothetical protein